jgi:hypothetical protein
LGQRPGAPPGPGVVVEAGFDGGQIGRPQAGWAAGARPVGQTGEALGPEARDGLPHRLLVDAEVAGRLGNGGAGGNSRDHP